MHPDIEKLINIAKESGELTEKQKGIILRKAEKLGEDVDEVEMFLESIRSKLFSKEQVKDTEKRMKCPNCGAIISGASFKCPECGYTLQQETKASIEARAMVQKLEERLLTAAQPASKTETIWAPDAPIKRQASVVNTFTMPTTKEGLSQFLEFAYSNYISISEGWSYKDRMLIPLKDAWYGKTMQAYNMLARLGKDDPEIPALLEGYSSLIKKERRKLSGMTKSIIVLGIIFIVCVGLCILMWNNL